MCRETPRYPSAEDAGACGPRAGGLSAACATRLFPGSAVARPDSWQDDAPPPTRTSPGCSSFFLLGGLEHAC